MVLGMSYTKWIGISITVAAFALASGQTTVNLKAQGRNVDFAGASLTKPFRMGTVLPAGCADGEMFFKANAVAGQNVYACVNGAWVGSTPLPPAAGEGGKVLGSDGTQPAWQALGGDVSGAPAAMAVRALRGKTLGTTEPVDGDWLRWNGVAGEWQATPPQSDLVAGNGLRLTGTTLAVEDAVVPLYTTGTGAPSGACTAGRDFYTDTAGGGLWTCGGSGVWMQTSLAGHVHGAEQITSGVMSLPRGGTNQGSWTAGRCVQVSADGTRLESAAAACGSGGGTAAPLPDVSRVAMWDDFLSGDKSTTASIGTLGWQQQGVGTFTELTSEANHPGLIRMDSTTSTTNNTATLHLMRTVGFQRSEMFDLTWIFRVNQADTSMVARVGLLGAATSAYNQPRPSDGIWLEKSASDTTWFWTIRSGGTDVQRIDTGVAVTAASWVKLRLRRVDSNTLGLTVNNGVELTSTATLPASPCTPWAVVHNGNTANSRTMDVDYFSLALTGLVR